MKHQGKSSIRLLRGINPVDGERQELTGLAKDSVSGFPTNRLKILLQTVAVVAARSGEHRVHYCLTLATTLS